MKQMEKIPKTIEAENKTKTLSRQDFPVPGSRLKTGDWFPTKNTCRKTNTNPAE
jgi:hypothetical protein